MKKIKLVDARMGRGKTSAAIRYMNDHISDKRFLYITPYLDEVSRICSSCDFTQPDDKDKAKIVSLKNLLRSGNNISSTHALFYMMDSECLNIIKDVGYTLIVDEAVDMIRKLMIKKDDFQMIIDALTTKDENNHLHWKNPSYSGAFSGYKRLADANRLYCMDSALFDIIPPTFFEAFEDIIMMTYLSKGQQQRAYLDYFNFEYEIWGIDSSDGYRFTDAPDAPPSVDFSKLIHIVDVERVNKVGRKRTALSDSWYRQRRDGHEDIAELARNMYWFFYKENKTKAKERLWTCFKSHASEFYGNNNRFKSSFLQQSARATNEYRDRKYLAYMTNRFLDPNVSKFFAKRGVVIDPDMYALGEMLQWIWRSRIRDGQPIEVYIPSKRMRTLLQNWINENKGE